MRDAGWHVGYAGPRAAAANREAIVAADRAGRVERVSLGRGLRTSRAAALRLWRGTDLIVAKLPPGPPGVGQLRRACSPRAGPRTSCW